MKELDETSKMHLLRGLNSQPNSRYRHFKSDQKNKTFLFA